MAGIIDRHARRADRIHASHDRRLLRRAVQRCLAPLGPAGRRRPALLTRPPSLTRRARTRREPRRPPARRPRRRRRARSRAGRGARTSDSVARFPGAPGAYGQPPVPPADASKIAIPSSRPASTFSSARPYVSCRCSASRVGRDPREERVRRRGARRPGARRRSCRRSRSRHSRGRAGATATRRPPRSRRRPRTGSRTRSRRSRAATTPLLAARSSTGANAASDSSIDMPMLCCVNASDAAVNTATASTPAASARSSPRRFGTSTG